MRPDPHPDLTHRRELFASPAADLLDRCTARRLAGGGPAMFSPDVPRRLAGVPADRLTALLERRCSVREFADTPVPRAQLAELCAAGTRAQTLLSARPAEGPRAVVWLVWARNVEGLPPGIHAYDEVAGDFSFVAALPDDRMWAHAVPSDFAGSPCVLLPLWTMDGAPPPDGVDATDRYLNSLLATGSSLYAAWLTALDLGLSGCLWRGVHSALLSAVLGRGGIGSRPFLALSAGHPAVPERTGATP